MSYGNATANTFDWRTFYTNQVSRCTFSSLELNMKEKLRKECFSTKKLVVRVGDARKAYKSTPGSVLIEMMDIASSIEATSPEHNVTKLEEKLRDLYASYRLSEYYSKIGETRAHMQAARSNSPRWMWATVYANMLVISSISPDALNNRQLISDVMFVNAQFAGPKFMDFVYMIITLKTILGIDPPGVDYIITEFIDILKHNYNDIVPPEHYYYEKTTQ